MSKLVRIAPGALVVGKPLPWTVYDAAGNVLLRQGYVIQSDTQLEQLFDRGLFQPRKIERRDTESFQDTRKRNPFADYPMLLQTLETTLAAITGREANALKRLIGLARLIDRMCEEAPDPSLGLVHLYSVEPSIHEQTLFYAILCHFMAETFGLDSKRRHVLTASALTANLALVPVADQLNASRKLLTEEQRAVIRKHPGRSVQALEAAGINNHLLLRTIAQHHEQADGSGYPEGLRGSEIMAEAEMLALAERYVAMITRRAYRPRLTVDGARKLIYSTADEQVRPAIPRALLSVLSEYPPGTLVRLANQEIAVITRRAETYKGPFAKSIIGPKGNRYNGTFDRDCSYPEFSILAIEQPEIMPSMDFGLIWGFS